LSADILVASVTLPNGPPSDPADRILIATARACSLVLLTRDRSILRYGDDGHVRTIAC
jgi:PIN domain nuclease of toxin-antitoxin system